MSVPAAYLAVILIWSTTPLAIQWSSGGWGHLFGLTGRMLLGVLVCLVLLLILKPGLPWHRRARHTYFAAGVSIYGAMLSVYWGAQFVPSGLIAVFYGLNPLLTSLIAAWWLKENSLGIAKLSGIALALAGLLTIFSADIIFGESAWQGVLAILFSVWLHSLSSVWIKRIDGQLAGLSVTSGGLLVAVPLFVLTWWIQDGHMPAEIPLQSVLAMIYLGVFGSALGFSLYYFLLSRLEANRVALITLVTPVLALLVGQWLNAEAIAIKIWLGSGLIVCGLVLHLWSDKRCGVEQLAAVKTLD